MRLPVLCSLLAISLLGDRALAAGAPASLYVDASEAPRRILHVKLDLPVAPGPLALVYPKWIPGEHGPTGPVGDLVGLKVRAGNEVLAWQRDPLDLYVVRLKVPAGVSALEVTYDFLFENEGGTYDTAVGASSQLMVLEWNLVTLYPQGAPARDLTYAATLRLPAGWKYGTALDVASEAPGVVQFKPVSLETLIDSPVNAGAHFRAVDLGTSGGLAHEIDLVADSEAALAARPETVAAWRKLVAETGELFGARHYRRYRFLLSLSDSIAHFGLEHHESSDNRVAERTLIDDDPLANEAGLLPHEMVHSWNGKYRRPADLTTDDYDQPMQGDLLWVYEGLTDYLGAVLTARSGLQKPELARDDLAETLAWMDHRPGRAWRSLADTAVAAQVLYNMPADWGAWRRGVDFYDEGRLLWLEADVVIRTRTKGARSLDDFCRRFHGGPSGAPALKTYTLDDVVSALNEVTPYDWRGFFQARVYQVAPRPPFGGVEGAGWRLVYDDKPNLAISAWEHARERVHLIYSLGLRLANDGTVQDALPGLPAWQAGVAPGMKITRVNGRKYSVDVLHDAVKATKTSTGSLELLVENAGFYQVLELDYHGGERYPHLVRDPGKPDLLGAIFKARAK